MKAQPETHGKGSINPGVNEAKSKHYMISDRTDTIDFYCNPLCSKQKQLNHKNLWQLLEQGSKFQNSHQYN